jgi:hypothetical protein
MADPDPKSYADCPNRYVLAYLDANHYADRYANINSNPNPHGNLHAFPNPYPHSDRNPMADSLALNLQINKLPILAARW